MKCRIGQRYVREWYGKSSKNKGVQAAFAGFPTSENITEDIKAPRWLSLMVYLMSKGYQNGHLLSRDSCLIISLFVIIIIIMGIQMEKLIKIDLATTTNLQCVTVVMTCDHSMTANDVYEALKTYIEEFKEETVQ